jgi:hypothetical protein
MQKLEIATNIIAPSSSESVILIVVIKAESGQVETIYWCHGLPRHGYPRLFSLNPVRTTPIGRDKLADNARAMSRQRLPTPSSKVPRDHVGVPPAGPFMSLL